MKKISLFRLFLVVTVIAIPFAAFGNRDRVGLILAGLIALNAAFLAAVMTLRQVWFLFQFLACAGAGGACGWLLDQATALIHGDSFIGPGVLLGLLAGACLIVIQTMPAED